MGRERRGRRQRRAGHRDSTDGCSVDEDRPEPLAGHAKYEKVGAVCFLNQREIKQCAHHLVDWQIVKLQELLFLFAVVHVEIHTV